MKLLVAGAGGQLGQEVVRLGREHGYTVIAPGSKDLDITDYAHVCAFIAGHRPDVIFNCAAYNAVDDAETEWRRAFLVNGLAVRNLALAANASGAVLVHYSTDYVFDGELRRPYTIADHPHPVSRYGESKLLGEQCVRDLAEQYFLVRVSSVFGKGGANFARKVIGWSCTNRVLRVVDDQVSVPTYAPDLARASLDLVKTRRYGLYHVTNSGYCSRYAWAKYILGRIGWDGELVPARSADFPSPARRPAYSVLDPFGTPETIGYSLPSWEGATERYLKEEGLL